MNKGAGHRAARTEVHGREQTMTIVNQLDDDNGLRIQGNESAHASVVTF